MKRFVLVSVLWSCLLCAVDTKIRPRDPVYGPTVDCRRINHPAEPKGVFIDYVRDEHSILGPSGKNICADTTGRNIAVQYGMNASGLFT